MAHPALERTPDTASSRRIQRFFELGELKTEREPWTAPRPHQGEYVGNTLSRSGLGLSIDVVVVPIRVRAPISCSTVGAVGAIERITRESIRAARKPAVPSASGRAAVMTSNVTLAQFELGGLTDASKGNGRNCCQTSKNTQRSAHLTLLGPMTV